MWNPFRRKEKPEDCVDGIVQKYFDSDEGMSEEDFEKLRECLGEWGEKEDPEYLGAMAYVKYREGDKNKMWDYIEKDLHLDLGEEEHGAFIPAMMKDVDPETRLEILKTIHTHTRGKLSLELLTTLAKELGRDGEIREFLEKHP